MAMAGAAAAAVAIPLITTLAPVALDIGKQALGMAMNAASSVASSNNDASKGNASQGPTW